MPGGYQRRATRSLKGEGAVCQGELGGLVNESIAGRRHWLNKFNLEDVVDIDLTVKSHLGLVGTVGSCILHSNGYESSGGIRTRSLKDVQFLDVSKRQQQRLKFRELREEQRRQVLNQQSRGYGSGDNKRLGPVGQSCSRGILLRVFLVGGGSRHDRKRKSSATITSIQETYVFASAIPRQDFLASPQP